MTCGCSEGVFMSGGGSRGGSRGGKSSKSALIKMAQGYKIKGASKMTKDDLQSHCDAASKDTKTYWLSRAKDLKIKGAYKMTKEDLKRAVLQS